METKAPYNHSVYNPSRQDARPTHPGDARPLSPLPPTPGDLLDTQEAADLMGKTYRQFTAYVSHHKLPHIGEKGEPPLYERALIQQEADKAARRGGPGQARRVALTALTALTAQEVSPSQAEDTEMALLPLSGRRELDVETLTHLAQVQGRAQGLAQAERVLTAREAAEVLRVSVRTLRASVPAWRRLGASARGDRWLLSQILYIEVCTEILSSGEKESGG